MAKQPFSVTFDTSDLMRGLNELEGEVDKWFADALEEMADTLLLLSSYEVPHDTGQMQSTGHKFPTHQAVISSQEISVAYDTEYAAYQHEGMRKDGTHIIKQYQKGRKSKYLEDPLKMNISTWQKITQEIISAKLKGSL